MASATSQDIYQRVFGDGVPDPSMTGAEPQMVNETEELDELAHKVEKDVADSEGPFQAWEGPAREDSRYYDSHQWDDIDRMRMEQLKRPALVFNDIKPIVDAVSGLERLNRQDVRVVSRALDSNELYDEAGDLASESLSCADDLCFIAGTSVRNGRVKRGFERIYKGPLVTIKLANGNDLTGTPNHPVLTDVGWKRLGVLKKGDNLIDGDALIEKIRPLKSHLKHMKAPIEERVRASNFRMATTLPCRAENFHGDGIGSEVYIVWAERLLTYKLEPFGLKQFLQRHFESGHLPFTFTSQAFAAKSMVASSGVIFIDTPPQSLHPSFGAKFFPQGATCFNERAKFNASLQQSPRYRISSNVERFSNVNVAPSFSVKTNDLCCGDFATHRISNDRWLGISQLVSSGFQALRDAATTYRQSFADLFGSKILREIESGQFVRTDRGRMSATVAVTETAIVSGASCQVFNLDTDCGFYVANGIIAHNCSASEEDSEIAKRMSITGMGWGEVKVSYQENLDGRIVWEKFPEWEARWDPSSRKANIEDSEWRARKREISRKKFEKQWPGMLEKIDANVPEMPYGQTEKYELVTPYYSIANEKANPQVGAGGAHKKTVSVIQYQWRDMQPIYRFEDEDSGEITTLNEDKWDRLEKRMKMLGSTPPPAVRQLQPVYRQVYVARGVILEDPVDLPGGFSLICMTGQWDDDKKRWYGMVRPMIDPQKTKNKAISSALGFHITNAKGGVIFKAKMFADPSMAKDQWSRHDAWIEADDNADLQKDYIQRDAKPLPPELPMFFAESTKAITRSSGVSEEMVGTAMGQTPSQTSGRRQQSSLVVLGWFFDNLNRHRRERARVTLEFIREFWTQGQFIQVGGDTNSKSIPLLKDSLPMDYSFVLDDSVRHNPNLKAQVWQDLIDSGVMQALMKFGLGRVILKLLKFSPFPAQLVNDINKEVAQNPPQPPQKGKGGGKQDDPGLVQAKTKLFDANAQKALAQARQIDQSTGVKVAEIGMEGMAKAHELRQKDQLNQHRANMDHRKSLMDAQTLGAAKPMLGNQAGTI